MKRMFTNMPIRLPLAALLAFFTLSAIADTEPNNSIAEANLLELDTEQAGNLGIDAGDINDYYQVELPANGNVTITATYDEGLSGFLYLYNSTGSQLGFVASVEGVLTVNCIAPGTVYARASRTVGSGNYTLTVSLDQPPNAVDAEPNNNIGEIQASFEENQVFTGQVGYFNGASSDTEDWYYLLSPRDGNVTLTATYDESLSGFIYLYEKDGTQISFSSINSATASVTAFCYAEDTLVARLTRTVGCGSYTASFETSTLQNTNDNEPNNNIGQVQDYFEEDEEFTGHLGYVDADFGTDTEDWFGVLSPRDGNVVLTVTYDEALSGFIYLYEKDGTQIGSSAISGGTASFTAFCYAADTLIARISWSTGCGAYTASFVTTSLDNENDSEFNNSQADIQDYYEEDEEFTGHLGYIDADFGTDTDDWFGIISPRDGNVALTVTYDEPLNGFIYLYEKDGTQIGFSAISGGTASFTAFCYAADTLAARISWSGGCGSYTASFSTSTLVNANDTEFNNAQADAQEFYSEGEVFTGHLGYIDADFGTDSDDWFGLITEQNGDVTLNVTYDEPLIGFIYLYRKGGGQIGFSAINGTSASFTAFCMAADTIYARISRTLGCGSYTASFEMSPVLFQNDVEPNSSIAEASAFNPDEINEGQIGYYDDDLGTDSDDYYEFTVATAPFDFEMNIVKSTDFSGFLYLYNSAGGQLGFVGHSGEIKTAYVATINEAGTYYFRVSRTAGCGSYAIYGPGLDVPIESDPISCSDGIDNNGDGLIDCEDPQCQVINNNVGCTTCFEDGLSFADEVLEYSNPCPNTITTDPSEALGVPNFISGDEGYVSLGGGGSVKLGFTNNTLINSGNDAPDLFVFEIGTLVEGSFIALHPANQDTEDALINEGIPDEDGDGYYEFGAIGGSTASIDIDEFFSDAESGSLFFDAIEITDDGTGCSGDTPGADIDAVCALSSAPCLIGSPCDDGNELTENDVFSSNCECEGTPIVFDCPELNANIGDECDDQDANTVDDEVTAECECAGTSIFDCPDLEANNGDACETEDGAVGTLVDCNCIADEVPGCTSLTACNYDPEATVDDDSCVEPVENCSECDENGDLVPIDTDGDGVCDADEIEGCTSLTACNYDPEATEDNDSCIEPVENCSECDENGDLVPVDSDDDGLCDANDPCPELADLENGDACIIDGGQPGTVADCNCVLDIIPGCTSQTACNYDPNATVDDDSCIEPIEGCLECDGEGGATEVDSDGDGICDADDPCPELSGLEDGDTCTTTEGEAGTVEDCNCVADPVEIPGCTSQTACNYNADATVNNGSCVEPIEGCVECDGNGGTMPVDSDGDGICDADDPCPELSGLENGDTCTTSEGEAGTVEDCICLADPIEIPGCTNQLACNFNPDANVDDDSCILNGDACELDGGEQGVLENCECVPDIPTDCENYVYYLSNTLSDGSTDIYSVSLEGNNAHLSWIASSEFEVHLALNEDNGLLYLVSKFDGSYGTLDPFTGEFGPVQALEHDIPEVVGATFNPDGKLMIVSQSKNAIFSIDLATNDLSVFDSYSPVLGGDIAFSSNGALHLATREGFGLLYLAIPDEISSDILLGDAPQFVTGIADTENSNFIMSHSFANTFEVVNYDGSPGTPYNLLLNGEPFETLFGDLTSGCADNYVSEECEQVIYFTNQPPGGGPYTLYSTTLNEDGTASNQSLLTGIAGHIGVTPDGSEVYIVGDGNLDIFNTESGTIENTLNIVNESGASISGFPACLVTDDGVLYVAGNGNNVYTVDPSSGIATLVTDAYTVRGGDLIEAPTGPGGAGEIWLIRRDNNSFTRISDGASFAVPVTQINGAAVLENGNVLVANGDGDGEDALIEIDLSDQSIVATYDIDFDARNGDLAATCVAPSEESDQKFITSNQMNPENTLSSFPNPTNGLSVAVFTIGQTERATLEVYDMNGRLVNELFNGVAESGVEYRIDFDGLALPNGIYMYRLTTDSETIIEKFMIAK